MSVFNNLAKFAALVSFLFAEVQASVILPNTTGAFNISVSTMAMVDQTRLDPFAPSPQPRAVMVSLFHPVEPCQCSGTSLVNYMPPATAEFINNEYSVYGIPNGTFSQLQFAQCDPVLKPRWRFLGPAATYPMLLFSPALGTSRLFYSDIAMAVASTGYTVVTIDHPYDADVVEFPDGTLVLAGNTSTDALIELDVETRAGDVSFVLNQLGKASISKQLVPGMTCGFDVRRVGMFGHSVGGAAVATSMLNDSRIVGGVNLDGSFFGPVIDAGLSRPFMLFGHEGKNASTDPSWAAFLPNLKGYKLELELEKSQHYSFSDLGTLVKILGLVADLPDAVIELIGTIDGERSVEIIKAYVSAFFDMVLKGKKPELLKGPSAAFSEVNFIVQ